MNYLYILFFFPQLITITKFVKHLTHKSEADKGYSLMQDHAQQPTYRSQNNQKQNENNYWGNKQVIHQLHKVRETAHKSS